MLEPSHPPNKLEIILSTVCFFVATILTGIIFPLIISTDKLTFSAIVGLLILIFLMVLLVVQSIFNIFYKHVQNKGKQNDTGI